MELKKRKPNRLKDHDYSSPGSYFITVCTYGRERILSEVVRSGEGSGYTVALTGYGELVRSAIESIPGVYACATVDSYVIMPNHVHLLITLHACGSGRPVVAPTGIDRILQQTKGYVSKAAGRRMWQKSFFDHVVRNAEDYASSKEFIKASPAMWIRNSHYFETGVE